jgi:hypothetical protein
MENYESTDSFIFTFNTEGGDEVKRETVLKKTSHQRNLSHYKTNALNDVECSTHAAQASTL